MRSGWIALILSLVLHGALAAALYLVPGSPLANRSASFAEESEPARPEVVTYLVSGRTDIMEINPAIPAAKPNQAKPVLAPVQEKTHVPTPAQGTTGKAMVPAAGKTPGNWGNSGSGEGRVSGGATTTFFQVPAKGQRIIYLIDGSASMGPTGALEIATRELLQSLRRLPADAQFQVIVYNRSSTSLPGGFRWLNPDPQSIGTIEQALATWPAEGGTDHLQALHQALIERPDVIFFLTDAGDVRPDLARTISSRNPGRAIIHVIEIHAGLDRGNDLPLRALARDNRGFFQIVRINN